MSARKTSLTLTDAAYAIAQGHQIEGEPMSATVSRLLLELETTNRVLEQLQALLAVQSLVDKLDKLQAKL